MQHQTTEARRLVFDTAALRFWTKFFRGNLAKASGIVQGVTMQADGTVICPFCGQSFEVVIDTGVESQRFVTDCEVCCRPFEVRVECEAGEILSLDVCSA